MCVITVFPPCASSAVCAINIGNAYSPQDPCQMSLDTCDRHYEHPNLLQLHARFILKTGMCVSTRPVVCLQMALLTQLPFCEMQSESLPFSFPTGTARVSYSFNNWFLTAITLTWSQWREHNHHQAFLREAEHDLRKPKNPLKQAITLSYCWGRSQSLLCPTVGWDLRFAVVVLMHTLLLSLYRWPLATKPQLAEK